MSDSFSSSVRDSDGEGSCSYLMVRTQKERHVVQWCGGGVVLHHAEAVGHGAEFKDVDEGTGPHSTVSWILTEIAKMNFKDSAPTGSCLPATASEPAKSNGNCAFIPDRMKAGQRAPDTCEL